MKIKNTIIIFCIAAFAFTSVDAQDEGTKKVVKRPVTNTFASGMLIDNPTIVNMDKGSFQIEINHRFGSVKNGWDDIFGIYAPSNILMGINYGILDRLSVGFSTEKNGKFQTLHVKYNILHQHRANGSPIAVAYYGSMSFDANKKEKFGDNYKFSKRLSYFNQVMAAHQWERAAHQLGLSYSHFNQVDSASFEFHDAINLSFGTKVKLWNDNGVIFEYSYSWLLGDYTKDYTIYPNHLALGMEFVTGTHVFQVFMTDSDVLNFQKDAVFKNVKRDQRLISSYLFGFNILIRIN